VVFVFVCLFVVVFGVDQRTRTEERRRGSAGGGVGGVWGGGGGGVGWGHGELCGRGLLAGGTARGVYVIFDFVCFSAGGRTVGGGGVGVCGGVLLFVSLTCLFLFLSV